MSTSPTGLRAALNLSAEERAALEARCHSNKRMEADRARVLLKLDQGHTSVQVATALGLHSVAVRRIKSLFLKERLASVQAGHRTGRPPHQRDAVMRLVETYVQRSKLMDPQGGPLSVAALRQRLRDEHHVNVSLGTVRSALQKGGIGTAGSATL